MKTLYEKHLAFLFLAALSVILVILAFLSPGYYGGADNINHYFIAHYAFKYPHLFLDPWGRPLYNILSSPFALAGFTGIKLFNVLLGILTGYFCYRIAKHLSLSPPYLALLFAILAPLYFIMLLTGLTEILFGFVLVLAIFLFFRGSFVASAIVISFLPFARTEGIIILPLFLLAFLFRKRYLPLPFLLTGFLVLSLAGAFYYKDFFWILTHNPYPLHHPVYKDKGSLFHFFRNLDDMLGIPLLIFVLAGTAVLAMNLFSKDPPVRRDAFWMTWMIFFPFAGYFLLHSVLYWQALGGSMGLTRVMAGVLPVAALVGMTGYDYIRRKILKKEWQRTGLLFAVIPAVFLVNFTSFRYPVRLSQEEELIREACRWLKTSGLKPVKVYFHDLNVPFYLGMDPYDNSVCVQQWFTQSLSSVPDSSVYIWDAHFGPNECRVPLDSLMLRTDFELIRLFRPGTGFRTLGGYDYEVCVFRKIVPGSPAGNYQRRDSLIREEEQRYLTGFVRSCDFERPGPDYNSSSLSTEVACSPVHSFLLDGSTEYSPGIFLKYSEVSKIRKDVRVAATVQVYSTEGFSDNPALLVFSLEDFRGSYAYFSQEIGSPDRKAGQWNRISLKASLPEIRSGGNRVKLYVWNRGKKRFWIDDLTVEFLFRK